MCSSPSLSINVTYSSSPGFGGDQSPCETAGVDEKVRRSTDHRGDWLKTELFRVVEVAEAYNLVVSGDAVERARG